EERCLGLRRLHHRGEEIRHRGSRGRHDRGWTPRGLPYAQREEGGGALVEVDTQLEALVTGERQHERCGARTGREDDLADARTGELVGPRPRPQRVRALQTHGWSTSAVAAARPTMARSSKRAPPASSAS